MDDETPDLILPGEWLPMVWGTDKDEAPVFDSAMTMRPDSWGAIQIDELAARAALTDLITLI